MMIKASFANISVIRTLAQWKTCFTSYAGILEYYIFAHNSRKRPLRFSLSCT